MANYEGKDRALAYGIVGGVAGAAIAVGPLIGGWVTTTFSWRYVFVGEAVIVIALLLLRGRMRPARRPSLARGSTSSARRCPRPGWGWPCSGSCRAAPGAGSSRWRATIGGHELTPFGFSSCRS